LHPLGPPGEFRRDLDESLFPPPLHFLVATLLPTLTFSLLFVFVVLRHNRRELLHFNVTDHPTAVWTAQQIIEAFPDDSAPRFLLRDRDAIYGEAFGRRVQDMGIREVLTAARAPWQNPFVERVIGSICHGRWGKKAA
jgi:hypothetical protein